MTSCPFLASAFFLVRLTQLHRHDACSASLGWIPALGWLSSDSWLKSGVGLCRRRASSVQKGRSVRLVGIGETARLRNLGVRKCVKGLREGSGGGGNLIDDASWSWEGACHC